MNTRVLTVDPTGPEPKAIREAAETLQRGGLVAFPTETVYGLGANALDADAVGSIFAAKGRPANNPVIVHVSDAAAATKLVALWPETAEKLAERFWPGPLTLVLPKAATIPAIVTAGGETVAVRAPSHPVSQALLQAVGLPIAAPSANRSSHVSPTDASHVLRGLDGRIDLLLDGGRCPGGIESTVVDLATDPPRLLRPGLVTAAALEAVVGSLDRATPGEAAGPLRSPGMLERHYAPEASLEIVESYPFERVHSLALAGLRVGWMKMGGGQNVGRSLAQAFIVELPDEANGYASHLYAALHAMDDAGVDRIVVDAPPDTPEWLAVRDRLRRAAAPR